MKWMASVKETLLSCFSDTMILLRQRRTPRDLATAPLHDRAELTVTYMRSA